MKRIILVFTFLSTLLCLVACKNQIEYAEKNIKDSCYWNDYEIVTMDIAYPEFDVDKYPRLNEAIFSEFSGLKNEYTALCKDR